MIELRRKMKTGGMRKRQAEETGKKTKDHAKTM